MITCGYMVCRANVAPTLQHGDTKSTHNHDPRDSVVTGMCPPANGRHTSPRRPATEHSYSVLGLRIDSNSTSHLDFQTASAVLSVDIRGHLRSAP